jgi:equilibrative nucleoside transporter 1/2/3
MAGKFPPAYMGAQMAGQAMGGVFPALVDIVVVAMDVEEKDVGFACFVIATLVLILCLLCLIWAFRSPFFKFYNDSPPATIQDELENDGRLTNPRLVDVLKTCWLYLLSMLLTFTVTLSVFPAVSVLVQAETFASGSLWARQYFTPVCVFLLFNMGDLLGRTLASWIKLPRRSTFGKCVLLLAAVSRIAFIPLFMLCNIPSNDGSTTRVIFGSDADFIAFMALFSLSNGYIGNMCMLNGPKASLDKQMQEAIALVLVAGLVVGTGLGSFISLPLTKAL